LDEARRVAAQGLAALEDCDEARLIRRVALAGLEAEAATAEAAMARRSAQELHASRRVAAGLLERIRTATADHRLVGLAAAELATAEAEWSRTDGSGDPARWSAAVAAWDAVGFPLPAVYARFRQAEALLAAGVSRSQVTPVLRDAWAVAVRLRAGWLEREAMALARRARIDLDPEAQPRRRQATPSPAQQLGLTPREGQVLALVADGRTNHQIAQALYITEKTASVHVSRILAKLGVANRAEAAAVAHRLRLDS
jgi:DNA-binding CsgD family transcriptional regulator